MTACTTCSGVRSRVSKSAGAQSNGSMCVMIGRRLSTPAACIDSDVRAQFLRHLQPGIIQIHGDDADTRLPRGLRHNLSQPAQTEYSHRLAQTKAAIVNAVQSNRAELGEDAQDRINAIWH